MQLSPHQKRVLTTLHRAREPMTAYALLEQLRQPGFTAPTQVYRALDRLIQHGLVHRLETLNAFVACSLNEECRRSITAFAICDTCGRIEEFVEADLSHSLVRWAHNNAFCVGSTTVEIHGQCAACQCQEPDRHPGPFRS
jgi:Fur family transcriptional regulator, zinc uptake regulator